MRVLQDAQARHLTGIDLLGLLKADRRSAATTRDAMAMRWHSE